MKEIVSRKELIEKVGALRGQACWAVIAGVGTGTHVSMEFGGKIYRKMVLQNDKLPEDVRNYIGEYRLYITCVWRIDTLDGVLAGAWGDYEQGGSSLSGLETLEGRRVTSVEVTEPALDMSIGFEGGYFLKLFCDQTEDEEWKNWVFFIGKEEAYIAGIKGTTSKETYT